MFSSRVTHKSLGGDVHAARRHPIAFPGRYPGKALSSGYPASTWSRPKRKCDSHPGLIGGIQ